MRLALFSLLLLITAPALAQIYKYTDEKGNTVFTNQPPEGIAVDTIELPPANTVDIRTPPPPPPLERDEDRSQQPYQNLSIGGIPDEQALRANNGTFVVTAQLDPPLRQGHQIRFLLDGIPQAEPSASTALQLNNVDRGTHVVEVQVLSGERVVQRSAKEFTVQRVHTSNPGRR